MKIRSFNIPQTGTQARENFAFLVSGILLSLIWLVGDIACGFNVNPLYVLASGIFLPMLINNILVDKLSLSKKDFSEYNIPNKHLFRQFLLLMIPFSIAVIATFTVLIKNDTCFSSIFILPLILNRLYCYYYDFPFSRIVLELSSSGPSNTKYDPLEAHRKRVFDNIYNPAKQCLSYNMFHKRNY